MPPATTKRDKGIAAEGRLYVDLLVDGGCCILLASIHERALLSALLSVYMQVIERRVAPLLYVVYTHDRALNSASTCVVYMHEKAL